MRASDLDQARLIAVWRRRRRNAWPDTFDEAMAHPLYSRIIVMEYECELREEHARRRAPAPAPRQRAVILKNEGIDLKRRASGERDDD